MLRAALLGVVQGLTEFLPISSDGHLTLIQAARGGLETDFALDVALHIGTLGSMLIFFRKDIARMLGNAFAKGPEQTGERRRLIYILIASVPTAIIGLLLKDTVGGQVASFRAAGIGFLVTALLLAGGEWGLRRGQKTFDQVPWWNAVILGIAQGAAVWPGLSRSGSTIAVALILGWRWEEAGRFSFMMAIPAVAGAVLLLARDMVALDLASMAVGIVVSFVVGCAALAALMRFLAARCLWPFAVYCALLSAYAFSR